MQLLQKPGHTKDECRKVKRKEEQKHNDGQSTKNTQSAQLVTKQNILRSSVGKAQELTFCSKTANSRTPNLPGRPQAKVTLTPNKRHQS